MVVHGRFGDGGLDELSTAGVNRISEAKDGQVTTRQFDPADLNLTLEDTTRLKVDSPNASAAVLRDVFSGNTGPARDIVCLNTAAALVVADIAADLAEGVNLAAQALDSGAAQATLKTLAAITQSDPTA